jgi:mannose-6-phosphate isomerase-like protein (cupin superfamily)
METKTQGRDTAGLRGVLPPDLPGGIELGGGAVRELVPAAATQGRVTLLEPRLGPRSLGSPVHTHHDTVELSIVTRGCIGVLLGDEELLAREGDVVVKPVGVPHAFWNPADQPARFVELLTPSGFERYFADLARILGPGGPDLERMGEVLAAHDIEADAASVPVLMERHGLVS